MAATPHLTEDHPLALELTSLRTTIARYQHEAHAASVKLQRHSLETTHALEDARLLEHENQQLAEEIAVLRANPDTTPNSASLQIPELTLALRKLSDKLTFTEEHLFSRTNEAVTFRNALNQARLELENARSLTAQAQAHIVQGRSRERELELRVKAANEERRMTDLVVQEYADLVRSLEGRAVKSTHHTVSSQANSSTTTLTESLAEGKSGLQKLLEEFNDESERMSADMSHLQAKLDTMGATLESERQISGDLRSQLASAIVEIDKYKVDDNTAAKMVSRYMKFSQSATDSLQKAMENIRTRHAATTSTLEAQIDSLRKSLSFERKQTETLRRALDELSEDISREAYGRRREISLRLAFLGREEGLAESLRHWTRKSKESFGRVLSKQPVSIDNSPLIEVFKRIVEDAENLLESLNGPVPFEDDTPPGSVARMVAAQDAVATLTRELHQETSRRLEAERRLAHFESMEGDPDAVPPYPDTKVNGHAPVSEQALKRAAPLPPPPLSIPTSERPLPKTPSAISPNVQPPAIPETPQPAQPGVLSSTTSPESTVPSVSPVSPDPVDVHQVKDSADDPVQPETNTQTPQDGPMPEPKDQPSPGPEEEESSMLEVTIASDEPAEPSSDPESQVTDVTDGSPSILATILPPVVEEAPDLPEIVVAPPEEPTSISDDPNVVNQPTEDVVAVHEGSPPTLADSLLDNADPDDDETLPVATIDIAPSPTPSSPSSLLEVSEPTEQQRLLADLLTTQHRYDHLQRSFRDCDIALKDLKREIAEDLSDTLEMTSVIQAAVERLNDYNEDARVELEIRISDEERIYTGYTTLLSVPGAISEEVDANELEDEIQTFVEGTDKAVAKAMTQLTRKLDDLQHDIACVKRTVHELASATEESMTSPEAAGSANSPNNGWSSWAGGLLGTSRPSSPAAPATFGTVMTSPRLRHSVSLSRMSSYTGLGAKSQHDSDNSHPSPFASPGLRIPMPAHVVSPPISLPRGRRPSLLGLGVQPTSRGPNPTAKPRVSSTSMYLLGLGARSASFSAGSVNGVGAGSQSTSSLPLQQQPIQEQYKVVQASPLHHHRGENGHKAMSHEEDQGGFDVE